MPLIDIQPGAAMVRGSTANPGLSGPAAAGAGSARQREREREPMTRPASAEAASQAAQDDDLALVRSLRPVAGGALAEVEHIGPKAGAGAVELVRLDARGRPWAQLRLGPTSPPLAIELAERLARAEGDAPILLPLAEGLGLAPFGPGIDALNACRSGVFGSCAEMGPWRAVVEQCADTDRLHLLHAGEGTARSVERGDLRLGGGRRITALAFHDEALFAAVADPMAGFDLFRLDLPDCAGWTLFLTRGAQRFALNAAVFAMLGTDQGLLLGTAALAAGPEAVGNWAPELILLLPDGQWDLIMGQPRFSPEGLKLPASARMPGMDLPGNAAVKAMAQGTIAGHPATVVALQDFAGAPVADRAAVLPDAMDYRGRLRLFVSLDLARWREMPHGMPTRTGEVTALCLTDQGLVIGHEADGSGRPPFSFIPLP